jgi:Protein of unknown function (DUF1499)
MHLPTIGAVTTLVLSGAALVLLAVAPLGWRLGWWPYGFGLYWLMPASGYVGVAAVTLSVLTLTLGWPKLRPRNLGMLIVAFCLSATLAYVPWQYSRVRSSLPPIHDITTDTDNPPAFSAALSARAAEHAGRVEYDDPQLPLLQRGAYSDLAPLRAAVPVAKAFSEALHAAKSMPGWTIVAADADRGHIEANQQSRWFRFTDDIVIRVSRDEAGSRVDMRAARGKVIMG